MSVVVVLIIVQNAKRKKDNMLYKYYLELLKADLFKQKYQAYLNTSLIKRLKGISYLCGMDYASKDVYDFKEKITRFDHTVSGASLVNYLNGTKEEVISFLCHDAGTPCFSHVIDYMNKDYEKQESTEEDLALLLKQDHHFLNLLQRDKITASQILNFKQYSLIDNDRPKLCVDRLDGIILNGISWSQTLTKESIRTILSCLAIYINEDGEKEIGFTNEQIARLVVKENNIIARYCEAKEDLFMMELLASITKYAIQQEYLFYHELYILSEESLLSRLKEIPDPFLHQRLMLFANIKRKDIPYVLHPPVKKRTLNPLVLGQRLN